jgi:hypothetical protein
MQNTDGAQTKIRSLNGCPQFWGHYCEPYSDIICSSNPNYLCYIPNVPVFMKIISGLAWFKEMSVLRNSSAVVVVVTLALLSTGCGKSKPPVVQAATDQNTNQMLTDHMPVYQPPSSAIPAVAATQPDGGPDLKELNRSLLRWILGNRRRPQNFEDFAATAGVVIPPPPAGKKYIIAKDMHIQLVDR